MFLMSYVGLLANGVDKHIFLSWRALHMCIEFDRRVNFVLMTNISNFSFQCFEWKHIDSLDFVSSFNSHWNDFELCSCIFLWVSALVIVARRMMCIEPFAKGGNVVVLNDRNYCFFSILWISSPVHDRIVWFYVTNDVFVFSNRTKNEPWRIMLISGCNYRMISVATWSD